MPPSAEAEVAVAQLVELEPEDFEDFVPEALADFDELELPQAAIARLAVAARATGTARRQVRRRVNTDIDSPLTDGVRIRPDR
jgi:hypothetical protein